MKHEDAHEGFARPASNHFLLPLEWIPLTARLRSWSEHRVVEYILRHTWTLSPWSVEAALTMDDLQYGRTLDGVRVDLGVGLGKKAIIDGLRAAMEQGLIVQDLGLSENMRTRKVYRLRQIGTPLSSEMAPDE